MNTKFAVLHQLWNINGGTYDAIEYAYVLSKLGTTNLIMYRLKDCVFGKNDNLESMKNGILDIISQQGLPIEEKMSVDVGGNEKYGRAIVVSVGV